MKLQLHNPKNGFKVNAEKMTQGSLLELYSFNSNLLSANKKHNEWLLYNFSQPTLSKNEKYLVCG